MTGQQGFTTTSSYKIYKNTHTHANNAFILIIKIYKNIIHVYVQKSPNWSEKAKIGIEPRGTILQHVVPAVISTTFQAVISTGLVTPVVLRLQLFTNKPNWTKPSSMCDRTTMDMFYYSI